ncbi:MAG: hypothetical protein AB7J13_11530, partial [Pyrinomonadaceae bacterium]
TPHPYRLTRSALRVERAQNDIVSVAVVLHQSGFPQIPHGRLLDTRLYPVAVMLRIPFSTMPSAACFG